MPALIIAPPIVQVALDQTNVEDALRTAAAAVRAGADWLEIGTPLVTFAGTAAISAVAKEFPHLPILVDYKTMDGARKYAIEAKARGASIATVCAQAADETVQAMVAGGREAEIAIVCDLINAPKVSSRAAEVEAFGVDAVYIHWGADQRNGQPERDSQRDVDAVLDSVRVPVAIATWSLEDAVRGMSRGASIGVIGYPLIGRPDEEEALRRYVAEAKAAWRSRAS